MADTIRDAFKRVKEDISQLRDQLISLADQISDLKRTLYKTDIQTDTPTGIQTPPYFLSTQNQTQPTDTKILDTNNTLEALKQPNSNISTGNQGVQTDRQTNRQTDTPPKKFALPNNQQDPISRLEKVSEVLNSLDALKKELRTQFKRLTNQEMLVFSAVYQLEDEGFSVDYSLLAKKTNLSESSIRDYVQKLIKKSIPIAKSKENNKRVILSIPHEFKKMTSLPTIISLRGL